MWCLSWPIFCFALTWKTSRSFLSLRLCFSLLSMLIYAVCVSQESRLETFTTASSCAFFWVSLISISCLDCFRPSCSYFGCTHTHAQKCPIRYRAQKEIRSSRKICANVVRPIEIAIRYGFVERQALYRTSIANIYKLFSMFQFHWVSRFISCSHSVRCWTRQTN